MVQRRENHVTREMQERLEALGVQTSDPDPIPAVSQDLADWLKRNYPQRTYRPLDGETLEQHLIYSGNVMLAEELIEAHSTRSDLVYAAAAALDGDGEQDQVIVNREHPGDI